MIVKLLGTLDSLTEETANLTIGGVTYAVMIPRTVYECLTADGAMGSEISLHTFYYIESGVGLGNLLPRIVGFLDARDLDFFHLLTTVPGFSVKKALRAMAAPTADIIRAIETDDAAALRRLPEVGNKTAQKIIVELAGKTGGFGFDVVSRVSRIPALGALPEYQAEAASVLAQLQYTPQEAAHLVRRTAEAHPGITTAEELIQKVFRK